MSTVLAVDGGNSKTDLALVAQDGQVLARGRGPGASPHVLGIRGSLDVLATAMDDACAAAGLGTPRPMADAAALFLAGIDQPDEEDRYRDAILATGWVAEAQVSNDTFALLRAGTDRDWGVAVVCGAGINACAVDATGRIGRYQALGELSGDWGGGWAVGMAALGAAIRGNDGRGPATTLTRAVPEAFGVASAETLADDVHRGRVSDQRLVELAPLVLEHSRAGDAVAQSIVDRLGDEVAVMATALLRRLELVGQGCDVVLGGGLLQSGDERLVGRVEADIGAFDPTARIRRPEAPPLLGAVRAGLRMLGAPHDALSRAEASLVPASARP
jgi:N-acetylglucosamine kinase-like BadF-type ATPase